MRYERPIFIAGILPSCSSLYPVLVLIRRASHICSMFITSGYLRSITRYASRWLNPLLLIQNTSFFENLRI